MDVTHQYEFILQRRGALLQRMEERRLQIRDHRSQRRGQAEAAHTRNKRLVQELNEIEQNLRDAQLPLAELHDLESTYWASVEESVPAWEFFLLGKGVHPFDAQQATGTKNKSGSTKNMGLPPRPRLTSQANSSKRKTLTAVGGAG